MAEVFISYARKDKGFARDLHDALKEANRDSWVDWHSIPYSTQWKAEIFAAIEGADNVLFVSLSSAPTRFDPRYARRKSRMPSPARSALSPFFTIRLKRSDYFLESRKFNGLTIQSSDSKLLSRN